MANGKTNKVLNKVKEDYGVEVHTIKVYDNPLGVNGFLVSVRLLDNRCFTSLGTAELHNMKEVEQWVRKILEEITTNGGKEA